MKFTLLFVFSSLLMFVSYSKNYSCNCTTVKNYPNHEYSDGTVSDSSNTTTYLGYVNGKKKDAESTCSAVGQDLSFNLPPNNGLDSTTFIMTCAI